jgi:hypothetical protein
MTSDRTATIHWSESRATGLDLCDNAGILDESGSRSAPLLFDPLRRKDDSRLTCKLSARVKSIKSHPAAALMLTVTGKYSVTPSTVELYGIWPTAKLARECQLAPFIANPDHPGHTYSES